MSLSSPTRYESCRSMMCSLNSYVASLTKLGYPRRTYRIDQSYHTGHLCSALMKPVVQRILFPIFARIPYLSKKELVGAYVLPPHGVLVINAENDRSSITRLTARCHIWSISWRDRECFSRGKMVPFKEIKVSLLFNLRMILYVLFCK